MHLCLSNRELVTLGTDDNQLAVKNDQLAYLTSLDLSDNNLGSHSLGSFVTAQIMSIVLRAPLLTRIDVSNNPFPPEILLDLHTNIRLENEIRENRITLLSEFTCWLNDKNPDQVTNDEYFVHTSQWYVKEWACSGDAAYGFYLINMIDMSVTAPEEWELLEDLIKKQISIPNTQGETMITAAIQLGDPANSLTLVRILGDMPYLEHLIQHPNLQALGEKPVHQLLAINRPDLIPILIQRAYQDDNPLKHISLALEAISKNHFIDAYHLLNKACALGYLRAHVYLVKLTEALPPSSDIKLSAEEIKSHLVAASSLDWLEVSARLALWYVNDKNITLSIRYTRIVMHALRLDPERESEITPQVLDRVKKMEYFFHNINNALGLVMDRRVKLIQERYPQHLPAYTYFNIVQWQHMLKLRVSAPAWRAFCEDPRASDWLAFHEKYGIDFNRLNEILIAATARDPLNTGLRSMELGPFYRAFGEHVQVITTPIPVKLQSGSLGNPHRLL